MSRFKKIAQKFEDRVENIDFFETSAIAKIQNDLLKIVDEETKQILFLIGEPGSGKSVFLDRLPSFLQGYETIKFDTPFFEPVDFIKTLITRSGEKVEDFSLESMIQQAIAIYKASNLFIAIDEAQLLSKPMVELIRILADSKAFWFLLAMHRHESEAILKEPQFASRPHKVLDMGGLTLDELFDFIQQELRLAHEESIARDFTKKYVKSIHKLCKGNFRESKKLLNKLFLLMDEAQKKGKKRWTKPSRCLLTMAAIDGGLIRV
ncbi:MULTISPECIES: ATP-binding protein [unclassified Nitratiruptor]|uniref:ATP-binding protein n=1 Tax=unclassified Nitratiruptor TaxID=2624044 RepID=UPI001915BE66|nr:MULTISPECIES: ATP-binding protein [unclassified Nitratiruptor]BCD60868.1 4-hydroxy-tetrahydrodipicolinate synthase [Nitratiruptor sp. YY08-10]BCD64800.1 hypothetical protein NitYY0814_C1654 [Nitratiruptor sp. YY08-14]